MAETRPSSTALHYGWLEGDASEELRPLLGRIRLIAFDFDGVFTDNHVYLSEDGRESVRCWRGDGLGLRELERLGLQIVILSTEVNVVVTARSQKLRVPCIQGCQDKLAELQRLAEGKAISLDEVAFVGNDINDLECLRAAGFPVVVADAHPIVRPHAKYTTRTPGGMGAVREVCDLFSYFLDGQETG